MDKKQQAHQGQRHQEAAKAGSGSAGGRKHCEAVQNEHDDSWVLQRKGDWQAAEGDLWLLWQSILAIFVRYSVEHVSWVVSRPNNRHNSPVVE